MIFSRELPTQLVVGRSVVLAVASEHRYGQHRSAEIEKLGKFPVRREVAENADVGEHRLGGKFRRFAAEQRRKVPDSVDGDRALRPFGGAVGDSRISKPCSCAPAQAVPFQNLQRLLAGRDRQRRQQERASPLSAGSSSSLTWTNASQTGFPFPVGGGRSTAHQRRTTRPPLAS